MTTERKCQLIIVIIRTLRAIARIRSEVFDEGDAFFALAFKTDDELNQIYRLVVQP